MSNIKKAPTVSVVVPVYNCEQFLQRCLDSIYAQTFTDYEIIAINDGSTDDSLKILKENARKHKNFTVIDQENQGQGHARNMAVDMSKAEYVLFVDSDDFIEPLTLELAVTRAENDKSDLVHFDWKFSSLLPHRPAAYLYLNKEPFAHKDMLVGSECDELLQLWHYYTVNNLFRRSFLKEHDVRYGEGRIYEDIIFMVLVANRAKKVSLLHSPLYVVYRNMESSSRSGYFDDRHSTGYLKAVENTLEVLNPRTKYTTYYLVKYLQTKFIFYYVKRVPRRLRHRFLKGYVDVMEGVDVNIPDNGSPERIMRLCMKYDVFNQKKYSLFRAIVMYKTKILPKRDRAILAAKKAKHRLVVGTTNYQKELKKPTIGKSILFLGFDYRYTGNSRYLFEQMIADERFKNREIRFITNDESVSSEYRVGVKTDEYYKWIARAEIIIAESWLQGHIKKRDDAVLIQLWHGTPLKKVLFDSSESEIMQRNERYRIGKHYNLMRWDYLLADSKVAIDKFKTAFLFPEKRILQAGYPRVKYLIDNVGNEKLKQQIAQKVGLDEELSSKKIVFYAPTWRDYNYGKPPEKQDYSYAANLNELAEALGDEYLVLYHDHHFLSQLPGGMHSRCIDVGSYETQELLLIADYLVTDYSSIMFDAFAIKLPVIVFANDYERYQKSRGVYGDIWRSLQPITVDSEEGIVEKVENYKIDKNYNGLTENYGYSSELSLVDFIDNIDVPSLDRDW